MMRLIAGAPFAVGVTLALFYLMRSLITGDFAPPEEAEIVGEINIAREERNEETRQDENQQRPEQREAPPPPPKPVSYTHLRAHETRSNLVCRLLLEKKKK